MLVSAHAVDFAILRSHFLYRQTVPKMGPWTCVSFISWLNSACGPKNGTAWRSHFWDRVYVKFCAFFAARLKKHDALVLIEIVWLMATRRATREALWAKPVLKRFSGPRIGSVGTSSFVGNFVSCYRAQGAYSLPLAPSCSSLLIIGFRLVAWLFAAANS